MYESHRKVGYKILLYQMPKVKLFKLLNLQLATTMFLETRTKTYLRSNIRFRLDKFKPHAYKRFQSGQ